MSNTSSKKDRVKNPRAGGRKRTRFIAIAATVAIVAVIGVIVGIRLNASGARNAGPVPRVSGNELFSSSTGTTAGPARVEHREIGSSEIQDGRIVFATADFSDGTAKYFRREVSGKEVNFFILKSSDGVIRAAFDACDVCFQARRGYRQEGDFMVCNNCGQRFLSTQVNEVRGGCNPSPLERTVDGDRLVIELADLSTGLYLF